MKKNLRFNLILLYLNDNNHLFTSLNKKENMVNTLFKNLLIISAGVLVMSACKKPVNSGTEKDVPEMPSTAPNYSKSTNDELAYLGRVLFYDKKLSSNNAIACASCHKQANGFADNGAMSEGVNGQLTSRNAPPVFPKNGRLFWDGRAGSLSDMVIMPITNTVEMNSTSFDALCTELAATSYYPKLFNAAFNSESITKEKIRAALTEFVSNFEFTDNRLKSSAIPFGKALTSDEKSGKDLFFGKAKCSECHHVDQSGSSGMGNGYGITDESHNIGLDYQSTDGGCGEFSKNTAQHGEFMMPVLLNIELTAPYMHDGRFATLEEVIEHYNSKVVLSSTLDWRLKDFSDFKDLNTAKANLDKNKNNKIEESEAPNRQAQRLNLSDSEKASLVKFLKTLTDKNLLSDNKFDNPFIH